MARPRSGFEVLGTKSKKKLVQNCIAFYVKVFVYFCDFAWSRDQGLFEVAVAISGKWKTKPVLVDEIIAAVLHATGRTEEVPPVVSEPHVQAVTTDQVADCLPDLRSRRYDDDFWGKTGRTAGFPVLCPVPGKAWVPVQCLRFQVNDHSHGCPCPCLRPRPVRRIRFGLLCT